MSQSFADLGVSRPVVAALAERGITEPFAIQQLVVRDVLDGRDVLAKSPTGSGKTLAFAIPIIERIEGANRGPAALVLAPTRELVSQIVEEARPLAAARRLNVAAGRTNREIGAELFMSEKTASVHVSRILAKLGVGGRVEAAAVAHRLGLTETTAGV